MVLTRSVRGRVSTAKVGAVTLSAAVALVSVSIAASQILLAATVAAAIPLARRRTVTGAAPVVLPLLLFMGWTVLTALTSNDVLRGASEIRRFFLYLIVFLTPLLLRNPASVTRAYRAVFLVAAVSGAAGLVQFLSTPLLDLDHRVTGFMSHWMTYSGLTMLVLVMLAACATGRDRAWRWAVPLGVLLCAGLYLSQTRNAWLGSVAGLATVFALKRPRALVPTGVVLALLYVTSPAGMRHRLHSGWDPTDPETAMRLELARTSVRLIRDNPWLGVGPKNVNVEALRYRGTPTFPDWLYQHMHNNVLQIASERGIPGLMLWLWLMGRLGWDAIALFRRGSNLEAGSDREDILMVSTAALGGWVALMVAGMFEYNFGDSEVVTLFLFLAAAPYVLLKRSESDSYPVSVTFGDIQNPRSKISTSP